MDPHSVPERRVFRALAVLAALSVVLAVAVNWVFAPGVGEPLPGPRIGRAPVPEPGETPEGGPALDLLPTRIIQYETITLQSIPGQGDRAAEAVYNTLSMNLEAQAAMNTYARAERLASSSEAQARADGLMDAYARDRQEVMINGITKATEGYTEDGGALMTAWTRGSTVVMVKTSFRDFVPAKENDLLERLHGPVVDAIELFQRTGKEGIGRDSSKEKPRESVLPPLEDESGAEPGGVGR